MSNPSVITLRVSAELKDRLVRLAKQEGVSMNQLVTYFLTEKVTAMEMSKSLRKRFERIQGKSEEELRSAAQSVFAKMKARQIADPDSDIPEWDRMPDELSSQSLRYSAQPSQQHIHEEGVDYQVKQDK
ncbi:MAG: toxin-antitoxin system HicB family antitoxin [Chloroflexota bacterium]